MNMQSSSFINHSSVEQFFMCALSSTSELWSKGNCFDHFRGTAHVRNLREFISWIEVCQQHKEPHPFFDGFYWLGLSPKSRRAWHLGQTTNLEYRSVLFFSIQLWRFHSQDCSARQWDRVHFQPKVKSSLDKPDMEAYSVSGSHYTYFLELLNRWMWIPHQT